MSKTGPAIIIAILVLLCPGSALAQEKQTVPVHLAQAVELALESRPELRRTMEMEYIARSKLKEARGNFLPTLDLSATSDYINNYDTFTGIDISAQIAGQQVDVQIEKEVPAYELNGALDLDYNLYAGGRDRALVDEARHNLEAAGHQREIGRRRVRLEVANAYWGLKKTQVQFVMAKRALEVVQLEMQVMQVRHDAARASDVAYEAVLVKGNERQVALRSADRQCLRAFGSYRQALGLSEDIETTSCAQLPELADEPDTQLATDDEPTVHPEILLIESDIQAAAEREKAAKAENRPKLDLFAKYALIGRDSDAYLDSWQDAQSNYYMVGLRVTMNLFNGYRTQERIRQAAAEQHVKRLELMEKERALAHERLSRKTELETARDQLSLAQARQRLARAQEKVARSELQSGRISRLEYRQKTVDAENAADEVGLARIDVAVAANALALMVLE